MRSSQPKASCPPTCPSTARGPRRRASQSHAPLGLSSAGSFSIQARRTMVRMRTTMTTQRRRRRRRRWRAMTPTPPCRPLCPAQGLWRYSGWRCCSRRSTRLNATTVDQSTLRSSRQQRRARCVVAARASPWARYQPSHAPLGRSAAGGSRLQVAWPSLRSSHGVTTTAARVVVRAARRRRTALQTT